jgi:hypothetical protein
MMLARQNLIAWNSGRRAATRDAPGRHPASVRVAVIAASTGVAARRGSGMIAAHEPDTVPVLHIGQISVTDDFHAGKSAAQSFPDVSKRK